MRRLFLFLLLGVFLITLGSSARSWNATDNVGLVTWFSFNESSGTTTANYIATNANGTLIKDPVRNTTGRIGNAISFINQTQGINVTTTSTAGNYSIGGWVSYNGTNEDTILFDTGVGRLLVYVATSGYIGIFDGSVRNSTIKTPTNGWFHLGVIVNTSGSFFFVNGTKLGQSSYTSRNIGPFFSVGNNMNFGGNVVYITIDDFFLFNKSISAEQMQAYANGTNPYNDGNQITITPNTPTNNTLILSGSNITFNWTSSSLDTLTNTTLYINGVVNESVNLTGTTNTTVLYKVLSTVGLYNWTVVTCTNLCTTSSNSFFNISLALANSVSYLNPIGEQLSNNFLANFTLPSNLEISSAYINYAGTNTSTNIISLGNNYYQLNVTLTSPLVSGTVNNTLYFFLLLNDSSTFRSNNYYQNVSDLTLGNCTAGGYTNVLYNFTIVDEGNQTILPPINQSTLAQVTFNLTSTNGLVQISSYSGNFTNTNPFAVCLSSNLSGTSYLLDGQVQYSANSYVKEFYNIQDEIINASDLNTNITLYNLASLNAQEFLITYTDQDFQPVDNALIFVQRKYINEGVFKTVEIPITDTNGQAIANLVLSDVIYSFIVIKQGVILGIFENKVAFCENVATGDCKINLNSYATTMAPDTFVDTDNYIFNINYNQTTREVTTTFIVSSGASATNLLNVTLYSLTGTTQLCYDTLITSSGTLSCTIPIAYQNNTLIISLYKDGVLKGKAIISQPGSPTDIYGSSRVVIALISFLLLIFLGISESPQYMTIWIGLGVIILALFNMFGNTSLTGKTSSVIWAIAVIIIILIKGAKR